MTSPQSWGLTAADRNESQRAVLAILAARLADDDEGILAVWRHCDKVSIVPAALGLIADHLDELGIDVAGWVARKQAELVGELAAGDALLQVIQMERLHPVMVNHLG